MKFYCGIDLHATNSFLCVIDDKDKVLLKEKLKNDLGAILHALESFSPRPSIVVEATINWYWLIDGLQEAGFDVKLAHSMALYMITGAKVKTDRRDAFSLAKLLRLDAIPEAYIYPKAKRPIRDLLRKRKQVVRLRANAYGALRRVLLQHGIYGYSQATIKSLTEAQLDQHLEHFATQAGCHLEVQRIRFYSDQIKTLENIILSSVSDDQRFELLQTIPGVGKILALTILYESGDINRFQSAKHFCSYARVVPGIAQSSGVSKRGRGSKQGNPHLKWAFCQAAAISVRYNTGIRKFRQRHLARRRSKAKKLVTLCIVSHKLAIASYNILKNRVPFKQELMFGS